MYGGPVLLAFGRLSHEQAGRDQRERAGEPAGPVTMTDALLTVPDQKEGLSLVYVKALATRAG